MSIEAEKYELTLLEKKLKYCIAVFKPVFADIGSIEILKILVKLKTTKTISDRKRLIKQVLNLCKM